MAPGARRLLLAASLAALALALLYLALPAASPPPASANAGAPADEVDAGFIGIVNYGHWRLICVPENAQQPAAQPARQPAAPLPAAAAPARGNVCRVNQEVAAKDRPGQVILAANLRVIGSKHRPALMLRLPPTVHTGDTVVLRFDGVHVVNTPVRLCSPSECQAAVWLTEAGWNGLTGAGAIEVELPASDGQRVLVDIPADGLAAAAAAMMRAEGVSAG